MSDINPISTCLSHEIENRVPLQALYEFALPVPKTAAKKTMAEMTLEEVMSEAENTTKDQPETAPNVMATVTLDLFQENKPLSSFQEALCRVREQTLEGQHSDWVNKYNFFRSQWLYTEGQEVILIDSNQEVALKKKINPFNQPISAQATAPKNPEDHKRWIPASDVMGELHPEDVAYLLSVFPPYVREYGWIAQRKESNESKATYYFSTSISPIAFTQAIKALDTLIASTESALDRARPQALKAGLEEIKKELKQQNPFDQNVFASFIVGDETRQAILSMRGQDPITTWDDYAEIYKTIPKNPQPDGVIPIGLEKNDLEASTIITDIPAFYPIKSTQLSLRDIYYLQALLGDNDCFRIIGDVDPHDLDTPHSILIRTASWFGLKDINLHALQKVLGLLKLDNKETLARARLEDFFDEVVGIEEKLHGRKLWTLLLNGGTFIAGGAIITGVWWATRKVKTAITTEKSVNQNRVEVGNKKDEKVEKGDDKRSEETSASASAMVSSTYFPPRRLRVAPVSAKPVSSSSSPPSVQEEGWSIPSISQETINAGLRNMGMALTAGGGVMSWMCATAVPGSVVFALPSGGGTVLANGACFAISGGTVAAGGMLMVLGNSGLKK